MIFEKKEVSKRSVWSILTERLEYPNQSLEVS